MADLIAVLVVALQYWLIVLVIGLKFGRAIPLGVATVIFGILGGVGIAFWHKKSWRTVREWIIMLGGSFTVGLAFFASDVLLAYLNGQTNPLLFPGGPLGIPLTLAICPGFTMICFAGLVRRIYLDRTRMGRS